MEKYPYELYVQKGTKGGKDENGFETEGNTEWVFHSKCYDQVLGKGVEFQHQNGKSVTCYSKVFMPEGTEEVLEGVKIEVRDGESVRLHGIANRFTKDVKHCRLWL